MGNGASKKRHGVLFISHDNKVTFCSVVCVIFFRIDNICNIYLSCTGAQDCV